MRMCLIGDSHVAMFIEQLAREPLENVEVQIVAQPGTGPQDASMHGSILAAETDELAEYLLKFGTPRTVDLNDFDLVVFISQTITAFDVFPLLRTHNVSNWNAAIVATENFEKHHRAPLEKHLLTESALVAALVDKARSRLTYKLAKKLRTSSDVPINIVPSPLLAETTLEKRPKITGLRRVQSSGDGANLYNCLSRACKMAFSDISDTQVIFQPEYTITKGCLTKESYREGSKRLESRKPHFQDDILHAGPNLARELLTLFT